MAEPPVKSYSHREELCSASIHGAGILFALAVFFPLCFKAAEKNDLLYLTGVIYYSFSLLLMFTVSTAYHLVREARKKMLLRQADHCAIYFLISGTYAPIMLGAVKSATGYWICGTLLFLALAGTAGKLRFGQKFHRFEVILYLLMGWCCLLVIVPLMHALSRYAMFLIFAGGIAYSAGVIFYVRKKEFSHAVWHLFVLAGAALHCLAILDI